MTCPKCGGELRHALAAMSATIKGEEVTFEAEVPQCVNCGHTVVMGKAFDLLNRRAADAYRRRHGLQTAEDFISAKKRLRLSWPAFAKFIGVSLVQLKRWLSGAIQSSALDELTRFKTDLRALEQHASKLRELEQGSQVITVPVGSISLTPGMTSTTVLVEGFPSSMPMFNVGGTFISSEFLDAPGYTLAIPGLMGPDAFLKVDDGDAPEQDSQRLAA